MRDYFGIQCLFTVLCFKNGLVIIKHHIFKNLFQLDPYMDESFISMAFKQMGVAVKGIKVIKSKTTGYELFSLCQLLF